MPLPPMGRYALRLTPSLLAGMLCHMTAYPVASAAESAKIAALAAQDPRRWSAEDISRHIDALDHPTDAQSTAQEVVRILAAIMSQPNHAMRTVLFNRLRPHIVPYQSDAHAAPARAPAANASRR